MKSPRNKLPLAKALLASTAATVPNVAPEADAGDDGELLVRTSDAAHKLRVSENTIRKYMQQGLLERIQIGTRTVRVSGRSLAKLMGQQAAE